MPENRIILIIDDEEDLVEAMAFQIKAKKPWITVHKAGDGRAGLEVLKTVTPHLIILDMNMPGMGGIEFYKNICDSKSKPKYPVLVLTARANLEQLFKDLNVDGFMTKPFEFETLFREIDVIFEKRYELPKKIAKANTKMQAKVLIADDDKDSFDKIALAFLSAGYMVEAAGSGLEAVDKVLSSVPDLILIKLGLTDIPGDIVVARLKQMPRTMDVQMILFTPESDRLNYEITNKICKSIGVKDVVESEDPLVLLRHAKYLLDA